MIILLGFCSFFFFFNDTATTEIYTLSLHDALPISDAGAHVTLSVPIEMHMRHGAPRSEEHTSELQSPCNLVCRLLLEKKKKIDVGCADGALVDTYRRLNPRALLRGIEMCTCAAEFAAQRLAELATVDFVFFFNDTAPTEIYTLSLHDALPI